MKIKNYSAVIEDSMTETKPVFIFMSIIELVLGIFLIIYPEIGSKVLTIILGAILAGVGVFNIITYLMSSGSSFRQGILSGVISTALGVAFIAQSEEITLTITSIILGVFVIFEGLTCCKRSIIMKRLDFSKWFILLIPALLACVLGVLMLVFPVFFGEIIMIVSGIILVVEAILGIWSVILIMQLRKKVLELMNEDGIIEVK